MKNLSGRLARKLQRSASLVNVGLSKQIQSVLDAAVFNRCDFVEICCSDAPCLTEAMRQRGISSSSLLRSDVVGNHGAQTREKLLGWTSEKRLRKQWFSPTGNRVPEQFDALQSSKRTYFSKFLRVCGSSLAIWWTHLLGMACKVYRLVFCGAA